MNLCSRLKKKRYRWVSKDRKTKFRINAFSSRKRTYKGGTENVFINMKQRCYNQFLEGKKKGEKFNFTTDKLAHYKKGFNKYFLHIATLTHGVPIKCKKNGLKRNNNCIERDHQYSRKVERNARGNKDFDGTSALFDVADIYYNYIDKQKLKGEKRWRTPAQRAEIKLDLGDKFQFLNLIKQAYPED